MILWDQAPDSVLPLLGTPQEAGLSNSDFQDWARSNSKKIIDELLIHGALLFRDFRFTELSQFERFTSNFCETFNDYAGGNSPRTKVGRHAFTATDYPKDTTISMHNEASYLNSMPRFVSFYCAQPAQAGGQTPLADCRKILTRIDPNVATRFERLGVRYIHNMHGGVGLGRSWMDVYETTDRRTVENKLRETNCTFEWTPGGGLRTSMKAAGTDSHPITLEKCWINQAEQWHPSSLNPDTREELLSIMSEAELPHNAIFGDGSPLSMTDLSNIRAAMTAEERTFQWKEGDVLLCDNFLVMHGRRPYLGERRIFAVMG
jgi:alpha-ketoglutarate-dependent taurine dioxygenase